MFITILHLSAILGILTLSIASWIWQMSLMLICLAGWLHAYRYYIARNYQNSVAHLHLQADGSWLILQRNGMALQASLVGESICTQWFVLIKFKLPNRKMTLPILLCRDEIGQDLLRRLRVWLLHVR